MNQLLLLKFCSGNVNVFKWIHWSIYGLYQVYVGTSLWADESNYRKQNFHNQNYKTQNDMINYEQIVRVILQQHIY